MKNIGILLLISFTPFVWSKPIEPPPLEPPPKEGDIPPPLLAPCAERDLEYYHKFSNTQVKKVTLFEGLPHHGWERDIYEDEKKNKEWIEIAEYPFYSDTKTINGKSAKKLTDLLLDTTLFDYYGGPKFCGGFHPDYAVQMDSVFLQICFGCHEMKLIDGDKEYIVDMKSGTKERLKKAFKRYKNQRPKSEYNSANNKGTFEP